MNNFITYETLVAYGVSENTLRGACKKYRKGLSSSWANKRDPTDSRKVLIDIDSIPNRTRLKHNIPTSKELQEIEDEKLNKLNKVLSDRDSSYIYGVLIEALTKGYVSLMFEYSDVCSDLEKREDLAKSHSIYRALIKLLGKKETIRGRLKTVFEVYSTLPKFKAKVYTKPTLSRNINKARKGIRKAVLHGQYGNKHRAIATHFHRSMILMYASQPNIYSYRVVADMVNIEAEKYNQKPMSESLIKAFLAETKNKSLLEEMRYGSTAYENNLLPFLPRTGEKFAGDLWVMDGTPSQFHFYDSDLKKWRRLNLYVIIDAFSGKIVGYDVSISEDRFNVINALKMAFTVHGHLPTEILHDHFSANKTDEIKAIKKDLALLGVSFRAAKVGNAKDKTQVERFFGTFQSIIQRNYDDYLGEGITSKRKNARSDIKFVQKARKRTRLTEEQLKHRLALQVEQYNNLSIKKASPTSRYETSPTPNVITLNLTQIPFLFWYRKTITIRNSMVQTTVRGVKYFYRINDNDLMLQLNGTKVDLFYDEKDLGMVHLFKTGLDIPICSCKQIVGPTASQVGRTEKDDLKILTHYARNKSFTKHIKDTFHKEVSKGLEEIGLTEFTPTDPLSTAKYNQNDTESKALTDYFFRENQIDPKEMNLLQNQVPRKTFYVNKNIDEDKLLTLKIKKEPIKVYKPKELND